MVIMVTKVIMVKMVIMVAMDIMVMIIVVVMVVIVIGTDRTTRTHGTDRKDKSERRDWRGNILRFIPFVMSGHSIFNFFQTLGTPIFNTNPNIGCPNRIYQHSGQAHKHFSNRFHGVSFLADVQT